MYNDVILLLQPESLRILLSCANYGFCYLNLDGITKLKYEKKNKKDSGHFSKMMPSCKWPIGNPQSVIQNPRLSRINLHEAILPMTISTSIIYLSLVICVWPCTLFNSKECHLQSVEDKYNSLLYPQFKKRVISYISIHVISSTTGYIKNVTDRGLLTNWFA